MSFEKALAFTLRWEGGYVNHPADPGGRTNYGVTQITYNAWRKQAGLPMQSVYRISKAEVLQIYRKFYWDPSHAQRMVLPLAITHFDTAVNFGTDGAARFLQSVLGVKVDGAIGPITLAALNQQNTLSSAISYCHSRIAYRHQRVRELPSQRVFLQGWLNRDHDLLNLLNRGDSQ